MFLKWFSQQKNNLSLDGNNKELQWRSAATPNIRYLTAAAASWIQRQEIWTLLHSVINDRVQTWSPSDTSRTWPRWCSGVWTGSNACSCFNIWRTDVEPSTYFWPRGVSAVWEALSVLLGSNLWLCVSKMFSGDDSYSKSSSSYLNVSAEGKLCGCLWEEG